ncbi:phosphofructokinase [Flavobacterium noncentrifugens]|uniref:6-phosphofructokinase 2 n=1 Tax=Flavobacterium noncentrifugens TaxID=1128970 RepID=A0A1G8WWV7_9FLAO|nr:1-phosphofructokinase family hexose kinase [Flavobacterium noncentrifugens]GEP51080.1 phosphofructokinase [Flavobacterium noncentrifugens]SDJ82693.1 6-phosphofructokinase 2 [Flavobacterium noncentrifugens]
MPKIVTVTFSPSIDKSTTVKMLIPEKKLKCSTPKSEPGGGGINVARVLKKLGTDAIAVFPSGGYTGKFFNQLLEKENVPSVIIPSQQETRENFVIRDESTGQQFRFGMPANELSETEWKACLEAVENIEGIDFIIASGSLPPGVPVSIFGKLAEISKRKKAKFIVDTSGPALKKAMAHEIFMLKSNLSELAYLSGTKKMPVSEAEQAARKILTTGHCQIIVVSLGEQGAILVTRNQVFRAKAPKIITKSTVGAGDSMLAGIVHALANGKSLKASLQFGISCGTAATMNYGTELCHVEDAESLFKTIRDSI